MKSIFKDCDFKIGIPFLSFVTLILLLDRRGMILWCLIAIFIHEFGHLICMAVQKRKLRKIHFCLFDIKIESSMDILRSYKHDMILMFSGPLANIIVFLLLELANIMLKNNFIRLFSIENILIGIFNLLPISSLDGGQILSLFLKMHVDEVYVDKILNLISIIFLVPVIILGMNVLLSSKYNFSLLLVSLYLLMRLFFCTDKCNKWLIEN